MPYEPDPYNMAELLQALDDVRDAARRVDRQRNVGEASREPASGAGQPRQPEPTDDDFAR
jgi:hypothetical protein